MQYVKGNIWQYHYGVPEKNWIVIPTNLCTNSTGHAVMGRGLALQAKERYTLLPLLLGEHIKQPIVGSLPKYFPEYKVICLPTKEDFREKSKVTLIEQGLEKLHDFAFMKKKLTGEDHELTYLPKLGCGEGGLDWESEVKPLMEKYLDDRFVLVDNKVKENATL